MKLLIILVLASVLVLKTAEGAAGDVDDLCDNDACKDTNAECKDESGTKYCRCKANYENSGGTCKLKNGQTCSADSDCAKGTCAKDIKKCGKPNDETCTNDVDCASGNCKTTGTEKKCADGASAIMASVLLMVSALVTSRFL